VKETQKGTAVIAKALDMKSPEFIFKTSDIRYLIENIR
jgi:hypothetical protein